MILGFEGDGGMVTMNPYKDMFCHTFGRAFDVWSYSGSNEMAEKSVISAALRGRPRGPKIE